MGKYFDKEVDDAIYEFQECTDRARREILCRNHILPAFTKLSTYWYHRLNLVNNEDTIQDCVSYLYEKIDMFDKAKGNRGFAYFNMIARHWYFQKLKVKKREILKESEIEITEANSQAQRSRSSEFDALIDDSMERKYERAEFFSLLRKELPKWKKRAKKENEKKVIDAVMTLFDDTENMDIFKKKAILFYLREITGLSNKQISSNLTKLKVKFYRFKSQYLAGRI